ncbi:DUF1983 domain-containing protein [Sphingomonas sp. IC081]|uniref:phage tail tip fiber protein n=1 Tax=Sphingomonas sp. IC081 TaxID=304378 RepID=UPI001158EDAB|nr:DUF1983 domain-containing protein [Sphingomonas sp. IC081]QDK32666.1 hypothetical protein DM450_07695 [Sphingomonas sp. IC081]
MPMAIPLLGAAFMAAGSIMTAVGVTAAIAGISLATIATVAGVALMAVSMLTMQVPKPDSTGQQLDTKLSAKAPVPVLYGHTATGGTLIYRELSGKKNGKLFMAMALSAAGPIAGVEYAYANDVGLNFYGNPSSTISMVTATTPSSKKLYRNKLAQRWLPGETPSTTTISQGFGGYGPAPKNPGLASGHALALVYADYDSDQFPQGLPKMLWTVRGVKVYDPRKDSTYPGGSGSHRLENAATWEFSENPFLCALHWTLGKFENGRKVVGIGAKSSEVDFPAFVRGANVADANGWKCGGVAATSDDKFAVLSTILAAGGGVPIARGAQISCHVNTPLTTTATITAADIVRDIEIQNSSSLRSRYNTVIPTYREPSQFWEIISGEQVTSSVYVEEDGGFQASKEVEFTMVQQAAQAHQLATYNLVNSREMLTFTLGLKLRSLSFRVGDAVMVAVPEIAAGSVKCLVINREYNPSDQVVTLTLKSENDAKHAFALGQSQVAPPTIALTGYDPTDMAEPEPTSWTAQGGTLTSETGVKPVIRIAGANDNPYTSAIIVEYRHVGSPVWAQAGVFSRDTTLVEITNVTSQTAYEIAISYRSAVGAVSDRAEFGPVIAGDETYSWTAVNGEGKPQDNATVGAPNGTPVGDRPAEEVIEDLDNATVVIRQLPDLVSSLVQQPIDELAALHLSYSAISLRKSIALADENAVAVRDLKTYVDDHNAIVSQDFLNLTSRVGQNEAGLLVLNQTYASETAATASQLTDLIARTGANEAQIVEEIAVRTDATGSLATSLDQISARTGDNEAAIQSSASAISDLTSATATRFDGLETRVGGAETLISNLQSSVNDGSTATANQLAQLGVRITDETSAREAAISTETQARVDGDGALSGRIDTISSDINASGTGLKAVIQTVQQTQSDQNAARASEITTLQSRLNNVNGEAGASIENKMSTLATLEGGLQSAWTLKVQQDVNGQRYVAGGGLVLENGVSDIAWLADSFRIMAAGQTPRQVFYADANGVRIDNAAIGVAAVDTLQIAGNAITANQVLTGADTAVAAGGTADFLSTGWLTIGDGVDGSGIISVAYTVDATSAYDASATLELFVDTGAGYPANPQISMVQGVTTDSGNSYWRQAGSLMHVVDGAQVRVRARIRSGVFMTKAVARPMTVRNIVMTLMGAKR